VFNSTVVETGRLGENNNAYALVRAHWFETFTSSCIVRLLVRFYLFALFIIGTPCISGFLLCCELQLYEFMTQTLPIPFARVTFTPIDLHNVIVRLRQCTTYSH
jgi:hypothetical protein